jgi:hypothetical protein
MHRNGADNWVLVKTANTVEDIQALTGMEILIIGTDLDADVLAAYPDLIAQKVAKIRGEGSLKLTQLNDVAGGYLKEERETWYVQKDEAKSWLVDNAATAPMLSAMASARGITVGDIAGLIIENVTLLEAASGDVLGKQQAALMSVYTAPDLVTAMNVEFPA